MHVPATLAETYSVAGRHWYVRTNSAALLASCRASFPDGAVGIRTKADLRLCIQVSDELLPEILGSPVCRGQKHLAFCYLGGGSAIVFDLRSRTAVGCVSAAIARNDKYWREVVFPFVLGLMSPVLGSVPLHAACMTYRRAGVVIGARSGMGKSTLAAALAKRGLDFLSDDWAYLNGDNGLRIYALPVPLKLLPDAVRFFPELQKLRVSEAQNGEMCVRVNPGEQFRARRAAACIPKTIILYNREPGVGPRVHRATTKEVVECFSEPLDCVPECLAPQRKQQLQLLRRLGEIDCYSVTCEGTPEEIAETMLKVCDREIPLSPPVRESGLSYEPEDLLRRAVATPYRTTITISGTPIEVVSDTPISESVNEPVNHLGSSFNATVISEPHHWPTTGSNFVYRDGPLGYAAFGRKGMMVFDSAASEAVAFLTPSTIRTKQFHRKVASFVAANQRT